MQEKQQDKTADTHSVTPLVKDKTYGERVYNLVFDQGLNFWANLLISASFSLWAASSRTRIKLPGMKEAATPSAVQNHIIDKVENSFIIKSMNKPDDIKRKRAVAMTEVFTLQLPGHFIMIPSVWLGAKIKPAFVRYFDKKHYGDNAEMDPSINYRHQMIDAEAKPTFIGAVIGRGGAMLANMGVSRLIGSEENMLNKVKGMKDFPGLNQVAYKFGTVVGEGVTGEMKLAGKVNDRLSKRFDWSEKQIERGLNQGTYNRVLPDYIGFAAMDTLYTAVTANLIHPIMGLLRHVPGMTYTTAPTPQTVTTATGELKVRIPKNRMAFAPETADAAPTIERDSSEQPKINVSEIKHLDRIENRQQEVSAG